MIRGVGRGLALALGALALAGCAGARVDLGAGTLPPLPQPDRPAAARLTVVPIEDARAAEDHEGRSGLFLQAVGDARFNEDVPGALTTLVLRRLAEAGLFAEVRAPGSADADEPIADPAADGPDFVLRGRLVTLAGERDAQRTPFISLVTLPLAIPLVIAGAVRAVPTPISVLVPVEYAGRAVLEVELVDARTEGVIWRWEVSGVARHEVEGWNDLFSDRGRRMAEAAREALGDAVTQLVGALAFGVGGPTGPGGTSSAAAIER